MALCTSMSELALAEAFGRHGGKPFQLGQAGNREIRAGLRYLQHRQVGRGFTDYSE